MEVKFKNCGTRVFMGNAWELIAELAPVNEAIIITDINIEGLYGDHFPDYPVITIGTGEAVKELETVETIIKHLVTIGADRSSFLLGIGGGLVCDITGFVASIYMRGVNFGFVSTSLLSQVDASIGGKNGVNIKGVKNIVGCFKHPSFVICDINMLKTLPDEEFISGLGELVKHALILDSNFFESIENSINSILDRNYDLLGELISKSIALKASVVEKDEKEDGLRRVLNFGHTLGHAIETATGSSHGLSVAAGMMTAVEISNDEGLISREETERIRNTLKLLGLLPGIQTSWQNIGDKILADKKKQGNTIHFVLLNGIGRAIQKEYEIVELIKKLKDKTG
ncbi:MAG: 3-dehydroquinate synthase [Bacteroidales bacterium]|nr:3-dehydroquinate synthase [Bacteroidales bacterium]